MATKPTAVERFETEKANTDETASMFMEHPLDRLKYHIVQSGGKIVKSEFSVDGMAFVIWEGQGSRYRAWSNWPADDYKVEWTSVK